jgi:uncharacterized protein YgbK (DUF1537 family)
MRIAVIADDLTGALDTGVQFSNWGFAVHVTDDPLSSSADVVVVNTDSRSLDPGRAYDLVFNIAEKVSGFDIIYKKTDSTLRGNVGAEIQAVLDATGEETAFLTPCYPPTARCIKDGHLLIYGVPIDQTEYSSEHESRQSYIPDLIRTGVTRPIIHLGDSSNIQRHSGIVVIDSESEADLLKIAKNLIEHKVSAGSAGLAAAIAETLVDPPPVLSVIGSRRTVTQRQTRALEKRLGAELIPLDMRKALNREPQTGAVLRAIEVFETRRDVIITSAPDPETVEMTVEAATSLGLSSTELETMITDALADTARALIEQTPLSGIILSGGATAMAVCAVLSVNEISIIEELRPGIPLLRLDDINAVTKAGGFGESDALIQASQYLKRKHT